MLYFLLLDDAVDILDALVAEQRSFVFDGVAQAQVFAAVGELHVQTDEGIWLVVEEALYLLVDPEKGIGAELGTTRGIKLIHGIDQSDIAFLDEVHDLVAGGHVYFGDTHHQWQVGMDELFACLGVALASTSGYGEFLFWCEGVIATDVAQVNVQQIVHVWFNELMFKV